MYTIDSLLHGDLGYSFEFELPVADVIGALKELHVPLVRWPTLKNSSGWGAMRITTCAKRLWASSSR